MYYCDPAWHNGRTVDAQFLITPEDDHESAIKPAFASCEKDIARALHIMLGKHKRVLIREVHNAKLVQPSQG
jgi:hypothetical protein